ncbi:hypothetical protein, partial [Salmonella enterica]|uniref:hypothetical protein n=1 Tax=Salmonella enterica TaxID=28901 RepID=UPI003FA747FF
VWGAHYTLSLTSQVASSDGRTLSVPWSASFETKTPSWRQAGRLASNPFTGEAPAVAFDSQGNAVAVWAQDVDGAGLTNVVSARFDAAARQWSTPTDIQASSLAAVAPQVSMDPAGNAIAVWQQDAPLGWSVWAS